MGLVSDGLDRAVQKAFTRPIPKSAGAQMRYLVKQLKGTRAAAELLGISQRTVERYVKDQIRPGPARTLPGVWQMPSVPAGSPASASRPAGRPRPARAS